MPGTSGPATGPRARPRTVDHYLAFLRRLPQYGESLLGCLQWQRTHPGRLWHWYDVKVLPRALALMVEYDLLHRFPEGYYVNERDEPLMTALRMVHDDYVRALARAEEIRRAEGEARQREERRRQEEAARRAAEEAARRRAAEEEARRREENQRVLREGSLEEMAARFEICDDLIVYALRRGFCRREIVTRFHVGEHRVSRIRRWLSDAGPSE